MSTFNILNKYDIIWCSWNVNRN